MPWYILIQVAVDLYGTIAPSMPSGSRQSRQARMHAIQIDCHVQATRSGLICADVIKARMNRSGEISDGSACFNSSWRASSRSRNTTIGCLFGDVVATACVV